jgi:hypothetical protein
MLKPYGKNGAAYLKTMAIERVTWELNGLK